MRKNVHWIGLSHFPGDKNKWVQSSPMLGTPSMVMQIAFTSSTQLYQTEGIHFVGDYQISQLKISRLNQFHVNLRPSILQLIESLRGRSTSYGPGPVFERWAAKQPWRIFSLIRLDVFYTMLLDFPALENLITIRTGTTGTFPATDVWTAVCYFFWRKKSNTFFEWSAPWHSFWHTIWKYI